MHCNAQEYWAVKGKNRQRYGTVDELHPTLTPPLKVVEPIIEGQQVISVVEVEGVDDRVTVLQTTKFKTAEDHHFVGSPCPSTCMPFLWVGEGWMTGKIVQ